jgi:hypothetical protein
MTLATSVARVRRDGEHARHTGILRLAHLVPLKRLGARSAASLMDYHVDVALREAWEPRVVLAAPALPLAAGGTNGMCGRALRDVV